MRVLINIIFKYFLFLLIGIQSAAASGSHLEFTNGGSLTGGSEILLKKGSDCLFPNTKLDAFASLCEYIELDESVDDELPHSKLTSVVTSTLIPLSDYHRCYLSIDQFLQLPLYTLFCQWRFDSTSLT